MISTLEELFKGNTILFEGLYIYDHWDWTQQHPVIRLDFGDVNNSLPADMELDLSSKISNIAQKYSITLSRKMAGGFAELIEKLHASTGQQVVVLIDEYDKPIIDNLANPEVMEANKKILHSFYQILKAVDEHLRFVFLTGVSKFAEPHFIFCSKQISTSYNFFNLQLSNLSNSIDQTRQFIVDTILR